MGRSEETQVKMLTALSDKLTDLDNGKPISLWVSVYGGFFLLALFFAWVSTRLWPSLIFESNSVRYILSALIQSQAAVISIVVTLTLIAVQWTASTYSPRVVEVFKRHPNMWLLLFSYIVSISFSTILLSSITGDVSSFLQRFSVFFAMYLGIFLFIALFPYILNTMNLLNGEKILIRLSGLINVSKIRPEEDPFQAFFDIIYGAIRRHDMTTMSTGLLLGRDKFEEIVGEHEGGKDKKYISFRFFDDIKRCGLLLIEKGEDKFVFEIVTRLKDLGKWAVEHSDNIVLRDVNLTLKDIGITAAEKKYSTVVDHVLKTLDELAQSVLNEGEEVKLHDHSHIISKLIDSISIIGRTAVRYEMSHSVDVAVLHISYVWRKYEVHRGQSPYLSLSSAIFKIADTAIDAQSSLADMYVDFILLSIDHTSKIFFNNGSEDGVRDILDALYSFSDRAHDMGHNNMYIKSFNCMSRISMNAPSGRLRDLAEEKLEQLHIKNQ